jgi:serine/threonine-protein kinase
MATVYLAEDTRHLRLVALKVLHPELAAAVGPQRFRREIAIAAQLQHPHILPLLDSGESPGGPLWFTMPYVEGESLRDRLAREHQLPLGEALRITREIAGALDYAHRRGVIHRDVKPENILLAADGQALLADFGVARDLLTGAGPSVERRLTDTGVSLGTLEYMSPEQTAGSRDIDARTDVYALGCVLYEMLAGEPPFTGATPQALVARRLVERPLPLRAVRDRIPESIEQAVEIALARSPADRYQTAAQFAAALDESLTSDDSPGRGRRSRRLAGGPRAPARRWMRIGAGLAVAAVLGVGLMFGWTKWKPRPTASAPERLAVLPFENIGDSVNQYFASGVTDQIRNKLAPLRGLQVVGRASSIQYRNTTKSPQVIADELGVRYLLTGQVQLKQMPRGVSHVHMHAVLLRVSAGSAPKTEWQAPFDGELADIFRMQAEIATSVASALDILVGADQQQVLSEQPTTNLEAYDAYLQAEALRGDPTPKPLHAREELYTRAVTEDSSFGLAWASLSYVHTAIYYGETPTVDEATAAAYALSRAQALLPGRPETQIVLSYYENGVRRDAMQARAAAEAGLTTAPDNVDLLTAAANSERSAGAWDLALQHAQRAALLDPRSLSAAASFGTSLHYLRRYRAAQAAYARALMLSPRMVGMVEFQAMVSLALGDTVGARATIAHALSVVDTTTLVTFFGGENSLCWILDDHLQQRLLSVGPTAFDDHGWWGLVRAETFWLRGDTMRARAFADTARRVFLRNLKETPDDGLGHATLGLALAYLGRKSQAIQEGEHGVALVPVATAHVAGLYPQQILAQIYTVVGEPDKAIDNLSALLRVPSFLSPAFLRVDPTWAPLRGNPRFDALTADSTRRQPATTQ